MKGYDHKTPGHTSHLLKQVDAKLSHVLVPLLTRVAVIVPKEKARACFVCAMAPTVAVNTKAVSLVRHGLQKRAPAALAGASVRCISASERRDRAQERRAHTGCAQQGRGSDSAARSP